MAPYHDVDSSAFAFETAARSAFREALREGGPVLLEPIMHLVVTSPEDYAGAVTGDMNARGQVRERGPRGDAYVVTGLASLANLFGYESQLRSLTQGRGTCEMHFAHYRPTLTVGGWPPPAVAAALRA